MVRNYDVRAAVARIDAARANLGLARSEQFPQFDLSTDVTSTRASRNGQLAIPSQSGRSRSFGSVLLNLLTFELDVWGRVRQQTKAARAELRASEEDRKAVLTTVVGDVATAISPSSSSTANWTSRSARSRRVKIHFASSRRVNKAASRQCPTFARRKNSCIRHHKPFLTPSA